MSTNKNNNNRRIDDGNGLMEDNKVFDTSVKKASKKKKIGSGKGV